MKVRKPGGTTRVESGLGGGAAWAGKRALTDGMGPIMRRSRAGADHVVADAAISARVDQAAQGAGQPLPSQLRGDLEPALGTDLSAVRVHTDAASEDAADALQAKAFAVGQNIHFGDGAYAPESTAGRHLIAHEVAHTVQQQGGASAIQRSTRVSSPGDDAERQADAFADAFVAGTSTAALVTPGMQPAADIHCFDRGEHIDIPTKHLTDLYAFLGTEEGKTWASTHGYDAKDLRARMKDDPAVKGEKLHGSADSNPGGKPTEYSYGDVTALMGDLFGKWQELQKASPTQKEGLLKASSTAEYQKYSNGKYVELAKKNDDHFAGKNKEAWLKHHLEALDVARSNPDASTLEVALFIDAAGAHFLTDAFSAGHQFRKGVVLAAVLMDLKKNPLQTTNPQMQAYVGALGDENTAQLIVKNIHDRMNVEGFPVTNDKGMTWKTMGDSHLGESPETQRIAALAVFESRQQVIAAHRGELGEDIADEIKKVADFFPSQETMQNAEATAISYIPEARKKVETVVYNERSSAPGELGSRIPLVGGVLGRIVESNLDTIGDPGRERELRLNEDLDQATGRDKGPHVDPSFTILRF